MNLLERLKRISLPVLLLGVALIGATGFAVNGDANKSAMQPTGARFTLPGGSTTVNLDAYRESFNKWNRQGGHKRSRGADQGTTDVTIEAYPWAHASGPKHVPSPGISVLVGHLINNGTRTTTMYSLKPGSVAEYYIFITNVEGQAGWEMREVANTSSGNMPIRARGMVNSCDHSPATKSEADFRSCSADANGSRRSLRLASSTGFVGMIADWFSTESRQSSFIDDPAWISCDGGCCTLNVD